MEFQPTRNGGFQSHGVPQIIQTKWLTILVLKPMVTLGSAILTNPQMDPNGCLTFFHTLNNPIQTQDIQLKNKNTISKPTKFRISKTKKQGVNQHEMDVYISEVKQFGISNKQNMTSMFRNINWTLANNIPLVRWQWPF